MVTRLHILCWISLLFLCNCSPQKRLQRLIKKHPELTETTFDTIRIRDTIYIESFSYDTTTIFARHDSMIVINNEKVFLKYFYDTLRQEIFHEIECKADTVYYETQIPIEVEKIVFKELSWWDKYKVIIYIISGLLIALFLLKRFKEYLPF